MLQARGYYLLARTRFLIMDENLQAALFANNTVFVELFYLLMSFLSICYYINSIG